MAIQSKLEKKGFEERNEKQLGRNSIQKSNPYDENHDLAKSHGEDNYTHPLGKGTGAGGYDHKDGKLDIYNTAAGGSYDINGREGIDGGRKWLTAINTYSASNAYGEDSVNTELNIADGQVSFF